MATAVETVKNFMSVLTNYSQDNSQVGRVALDEAVRRVSFFSSLQEATLGLQVMLSDEKTYSDSDTRLKEVTGMVIGAEDDYSADTGAITGSNAGGSTVKNAQDIVPEDNVDLSTLPLPEPGSTTPITYTGNDGNAFTFYAKWPDSFSTAIYAPDDDDSVELQTLIKDSKYHYDLNTLDENGTYEIDTGIPLLDGETLKKTSPTVEQMKSAIITAIKGLYNYWLREGAKLNYDSLGLALNGQTLEIAFGGGGEFNDLSAVTSSSRIDKLPSDYIYLGISLSNYGKLNSTNPNGSTNIDGDGSAPSDLYLDRVIAHEMVHAVMLATGTLKDNMPQFFTEGIADLVQGDDDYNSEQTSYMKNFVNDPKELKEALQFLEGTGTGAAYPAGDMLMRFIAQQGLDFTQFVGDSSQAETFSYDTNGAIITNYGEEDTINYDKTFKGAEISTTLNDIIIESEGDEDDNNFLTLRDVRGKVITLNTSEGTTYAYMAPYATEVDGRNFNDGYNFEIIFGSNYENDVIRAGNGGSYLWGGKQGNDELFGGNGEDTFTYNYGDDNDTIQNADSQDNVLLGNMTLDEITIAQIYDNGVYVKFRDGGSLTVNGTPSAFTINDSDDENVTYRADYQTKEWIEEN